MRPRSHILETESRKAFDQVIPSAWVVRPQDSDYGLDVQVQIFENGRITPFLFYAQLKATDTLQEESNIAAHSFSALRLLHYFQSPIPVMLVLFDARGKRLFFEWAHALYLQLSEEGLRKLNSQNTFTVKLHRLLSAQEIALIKKEVRNQFSRFGYRPSSEDTLTIVLSADVPDEYREISKAIVAWISEDPSTQFIRIKERYKEPDGTIQVHFDSSGKSPPLISVTCLRDEFVHPLSDDVSIGRDELFSDVILAIALVLSMAGRSNSALDVLSRFFGEERPLTFFARARLMRPSIATMYAGVKRSAEAMDIAERLLRRGYVEPAMVMSAAVLLADNREFYSQQLRRFLKAVIESDEGKEKGFAEYNLANSLRHDGYHREALQHYRKAALKDPSYRNRSYWWAEVAGCLFLLEKFKWSEGFYRKAMSLGESRLPVRALLGDALLHQGRFNEAKIALEKCTETTHPISADAALRSWLAEMLLRNFGDTRRNPPGARNLVKRALEVDDSGQRERYLLEAITVDPLCGAAWFNYAVSGTKPANGKGVFWLIAAILEPWGIEAWVNAVFLITIGGREEMLPLIAAAVCEAFRLHGSFFETTLEDVLRQQPTLAEQDVEAILGAINDMRKECSTMFEQEPPVVLRNIGKEASV